MNDVKPLKRALVTGGSGGLGQAIAQQLARDGLHVIVHASKGLDKALGVVDAIVQAGGSAEAVAFDVTDRVATAQALERLVRAGPVQVLVNNAGIHDDGVFPGMRGEQWDRVIDVSLNGFFQRHPAPVFAHAAHPLGAGDQHFVGGGGGGQPGAGELRGRQRGLARGQQVAGT